MENKHKKTRSIVSLLLLAVLTFTFVIAGNNVAFASETNGSTTVSGNRSSEDSKLSLLESSSDVKVAPSIDNFLDINNISKPNTNTLLKSGNNQIGSIVGDVYGSSGELSFTLPSSHWGVDVLAGTYDSNASGLVQCYMVKPNGKTVYLGTINAKNDHTDYYYLSYCPKGTYKFIYIGTTSETKFCYARMFNI